MKLLFASRYPENLDMDAAFAASEEKGKKAKAVSGSYTLIAVVLSIAAPALVCRFCSIPIIPLQFSDGGVSVSATAFLLALAAQVVLAALTVLVLLLALPKGERCCGVLLSPFGGFARFGGFLSKGRYLTALLLPICLFSVLPALFLPLLQSYSPSWAHTLAMTALLYGFSRFPDIQEVLSVCELPKGALVRRYANTTYYRTDDAHENQITQR